MFAIVQNLSHFKNKISNNWTYVIGFKKKLSPKRISDSNLISYYLVNMAKFIVGTLDSVCFAAKINAASAKV